MRLVPATACGAASGIAGCCVAGMPLTSSQVASPTRMFNDPAVMVMMQQMQAARTTFVSQTKREEKEITS